MAATTRAHLSPADQADLIKRYFPALLPYSTVDDPNTWKAPSTSERGVEYTVTIGHAGEWVCSCRATRTCKHQLLVQELDVRVPDAIEFMREDDPPALPVPRFNWSKRHIYQAEDDRTAGIA